MLTVRGIDRKGRQIRQGSLFGQRGRQRGGELGQLNT